MTRKTILWMTLFSLLGVLLGVSHGAEIADAVRITGTTIAVVLLIGVMILLHVVVRRIRELYELALGDFDKIKNSMVKIGEWMVHFDIALGKVFEDKGIMEEGASFAETVETFQETMERLQNFEGSGFDGIDEIVDLTEEIEIVEEPKERELPEGLVAERIDAHTVHIKKKEPENYRVPSASIIPNFNFKGDWRETEEYVSMRDNQEGC